MRRRRRLLKYLDTPLGITVIYVMISTLCLFGTAPFVARMICVPYVFISVRVIQVAVIAYILYNVIRRSHLALARSRQDYQDLLELGREPIVVHRRGIIVDANEFAMKLFDASSKEELIGQNILGFAHPDDCERASQRVDQLQSGIPTDVAEMKMISAKGIVKDIELLGIPKKTSKGPAVQLLLRDITARKQTERELQNVVEVFRIIESNMSDLITILDRDGKVKYASPSHLQILGRGIAVGGSDKPMAINIHADDQRRVSNTYGQMMKRKEPLREEFRLQRADGDWLFVEMHGTPFVDINGEVEGAVLVTRDITERKLTEELLRRSDKLAAVGQLAAGLAHEVRNPMTVLQGFIQLLRTTEKPNDDYIAIMLSEVQRIESIIREFLVFAKPAQAQFSVVDVCQLIRYTVALLETQAIMKSIQIDTDFDVEFIAIRCNEDNVKQVFINVIKNAIEAMSNGGTLVIKLTLSDEHVRITVIDEGEGIPEDVIQKLGEPFFTTKVSGTGLGLMVTLKLVENNHGQMRFTSELGVGTQVEISFPVASSITAVP